MIKDTNELCILSHTSVTATAETSVVTFIGFHATKPHLECGNYYTDTFFYCLRIAVDLSLNTLTGNKTGTSFVCSR